MATIRHRVFVYGTLKKGGALHQHLGYAEFLGLDKLNGYMMFNTGWFPTVVKTHDQTKAIHGEVYLVDDLNFNRLDTVEGNLFKKERCKTSYGTAFIYIHNDNYPSPFTNTNFARIEDGFFYVGNND